MNRGGYVDVEGAFGLVADVDGAAVSLAVTTPKTLVAITDPAGASADFDADAPEVLANAAANTEFRGVALAPTAVTGPSVYVRTPVSGAATAVGTSVKVSAYVDSPDGVGSCQGQARLRRLRQRDQGCRQRLDRDRTDHGPRDRCSNADGERHR